MNKTKILIVEDESIIAKDMQTILREAGYHVPHTASNSKDALKFTEELTPDLILMDVIIQGPVDGITTAQIISHLYDIPIIFLSAYSDRSTLDRARTVASFGYLLKPCDEKELLISVDFGLQKARMDRLIKNQNKLYSAVICNFETGAIVINPEGKIELVNPQAESILGWKDAEINKKPIHELMPGFGQLNQASRDEQNGSILSKRNGPLNLNIRLQNLTDSEQKVTGTLIYLIQGKDQKSTKAS
jgi:CheY-like chemotaxis protein